MCMRNQASTSNRKQSTLPNQPHPAGVHSGQTHSWHLQNGVVILPKSTNAKRAAYVSKLLLTDRRFACSSNSFFSHFFLFRLLPLSYTPQIIACLRLIDCSLFLSENLALFDFKLSDAQMKKITDLHAPDAPPKRTCGDPNAII